MSSQESAHLTFTCSNLTTEILERYVKYVQSRQQKHRNNVNDVVLVFLLLTLNIFHTFFLSFYYWLWKSKCQLGDKRSFSILTVTSSTFKTGWQHLTNTAQKIKFSIKYFFNKCDQIPRKLQIWSHLVKKSLMENFIFCVV